MTSSPRERGSSGWRWQRHLHPGVVPARAGVIRDGSWTSPGSWSRPRASGGHPPDRWRRCGFLASSPRERGSSPSPPRCLRGQPVVPARAGVIPVRPADDDVGGRRPRASGGHPDDAPTVGPHDQSSPRERGSSSARPAARLEGTVVPARAGVIRRGWACASGPECRPRASGGHPRGNAMRRPADVSSPRERGSSPVPHL